VLSRRRLLHDDVAAAVGVGPNAADRRGDLFAIDGEQIGTPIDRDVRAGVAARRGVVRETRPRRALRARAVRR
jgi:hypothetical protein